MSKMSDADRIVKSLKELLTLTFHEATEEDISNIVMKHYETIKNWNSEQMETLLQLFKKELEEKKDE